MGAQWYVQTAGHQAAREHIGQCAKPSWGHGYTLVCGQQRGRPPSPLHFTIRWSSKQYCLCLLRFLINSLHSSSRIFFLLLLSFPPSPPWHIQDHREYEHITAIIVYANPGLLHCRWLCHCAQMVLLGVFLKWNVLSWRGPLSPLSSLPTSTHKDHH